MMVVMIADLGREFTVRLLHVDFIDKVVSLCSSDYSGLDSECL